MTLMQWKIEELPDCTPVVVISGFISEEADFRPLTALTQSSVLRLDLAGVEQINSCGVREWIHFVRALGTAFELRRCSPAIVRQLNIISNFRGSARVHSVMLPYFCGDCGREEHRLLELPPSGPLPAIADALTCPGCGNTMEFDDLPNTYMAFAA